MQYVPYHKLGDSPNIIVDGRSNKATVLTLSHWPNSGTPVSYKDDLSAQGLHVLEDFLPLVPIIGSSLFSVE